MMIRVPFRSPPHLPPPADGTARWLAPFLVALMVYVAGLAAIGLILVDQTLRAAQDGLAGRLTVQVPAETSEARLQTVLAVLRQTQGIRSVRLLSPEETGRLLEPWLGSPASVVELPVPRLIDAQFDRAAALDLAKLRTQLAPVVSDIRIDDYGRVVGGLHTRARPMQALLGAAIGASLLLVAALAAFATGAALASRRTDIELLYLLGADDRQLTRPYVARSLANGLIGGAVAAAAILATVAALGDSLGGAGSLLRPAAPSDGIGLGDWQLWSVLAIMIAAAGIFALMGAQSALRRRLAQLP